ncbi:MAG: ferrous iron transport protein A [Cytophagales bacterium]|nr:ferrous iron transport protein A [Cytophagales bacterium]MDW8384969.1 FeoA family protein [Flammeovirgaceae bacterium]
MNLRTLANVSKGEIFVLHNFSDENVAISMMELGCIPPIKIQVLGWALGGCPLYVKANNTLLAIRLKDAQKMIGI